MKQRKMPEAERRGFVRYLRTSLTDRELYNLYYIITIGSTSEAYLRSRFDMPLRWVRLIHSYRTATRAIVYMVLPSLYPHMK